VLRRRSRILAAAVDSPLGLFLGVALVLRVLTDDRSSPYSRHSGSINLSAAIAALFIVAAIGLQVRCRRRLLPAIAAVVWLCVWTAIAVSTRGASTETIREGVREASVIALAVIVYDARPKITVSVATRLVQVAGSASALLAGYQLATHTGMDVAGHVRSNGTFAQPNSAAMYFALAAVASLWRYLDNQRHRSDAVFTALFAAAVVATFSIDGLITLVVMLIAFGALHPGRFRIKLIPYLLAGLVVAVFLATPLGTARVAKESSTSITAAERGEANTTLAWRFHKWKTLLSEWDRAPLVGKGLGTTTTVEGIPGDVYTGALPHNEYIRYLVETGVVGLATLLCGLGILIRSLVRRRRVLDSPRSDASNQATLAIVVVGGCLVNSLADNTFLNSPTCYAAALIVTAALGIGAVGTRATPNPRAM
jgi:putative inorganic carbon (hco3(-)) transporter